MIKSGTRYKVIKTKTFVFLDQMAFCAPGTSLAKFLKAYGIVEQKFCFPYEWFDSYEKLEHLVCDLKIEDFDSTLKNSKMEQSEFIEFNETCERENLKTIADLLKYYNNLDVKPLLEACLKNKKLFYEYELDMYKDAVNLYQV
jgi:hypothetical protein